MWAKLEGWLFNKVAGKLVARAAVTLCGLLASEKVKAVLSAYGVSVEVRPEELAAGAIAAGHGLYEWFKHWRIKRQAPQDPAPAQ